MRPHRRKTQTFRLHQKTIMFDDRRQVDVKLLLTSLPHEGVLWHAPHQ